MTFDYLSQQQLLQKVRSIDPFRYEKGRNYIGGAVSRLSPYLTHGVITTPQVIFAVLEQYSPEEAESLLKELLWKEWFVQVHRHKKDLIFGNMEEPKMQDAWRDILPGELQMARTGQHRLDTIAKELTQTGYLHNHMRMWMASYLVHYQKLHWKKLADWTYYHFLDGELSSNYLSWQWVASTFSSKPYIFNADNMNRYWPNHHPKQLNLDYPELEKLLFEGKTDQTSFSVSELPVTKLKPTEIYPKIEGDTALVLTPRHLGHVTSNCVVVLDVDFLTSSSLVKTKNGMGEWLCRIFGLTCCGWFVCRDYQILSRTMKKVSLYETVNPVYRDVNEGYADVCEIQRLGPAKSAYFNRFFQYWKRTESALWERWREYTL